MFNEWLWAFAISHNEFVALGALQRGTFGYPIPVDDYRIFLNRYRPNYVFWRRTAPVPRGFGKTLQLFREVVYKDADSEVWRLDFTKYAPDAKP